MLSCTCPPNSVLIRKASFTESIHEPSDIEFGFILGWSSSISANAAVTNTVASEVPLLEYHVSPLPVLMIPSPGAMISGFRFGWLLCSPLVVVCEPRELFSQTSPPLVDAPTDIALATLLGTETLPSSSAPPSLPAAAMTYIPISTALRVTEAEAPSRIIPSV